MSNAVQSGHWADVLTRIIDGMEKSGDWRLSEDEAFAIAKVAHHLRALASSSSPDWQPIETAPKDGTKVLLVEDDQPSEVCTGWWVGGAWRDWGDIGCNGQEDYTPTHWMPLPFGPSALEQGRVK